MAQGREIRPDEMIVIGRLAAKYPDLHQAEKDLEQVDTLKQQVAEVSRPSVVRGSKDAGATGVHPRSVDDLMRLRDAGIISDTTIRWFLGVEERRREPAPPLPAPKELWAGHVPERVAFGAIWRIGLLAAVLVVERFSALVTALALLVVLIGLAAIGVRLHLWKRLTLPGAIWREAVALVLFYGAFRFAPTLAVLAVVGVVLVLALGTDALLSVLEQEDY